MNKTIIIFALLSIFTNNIKAQQQECPDFEWLRSMYSDIGLAITDLHKDSYNNIYLCGNYMGNLTIGSFTLPAPQGINKTAGWIGRFDSLGNCKWVTHIKGLNNVSSAYFRAIQSDIEYIYISGSFIGSVVVQDDTLMPTLNDKHHGIITKLDSAGNLIWNQVHTNLFHWNIEMMSLGNIYIISQLHDTAVLGTHTLVPSGTGNLVVSGINFQGQVQWVEHVGGAITAINFYQAIAKDAQDNLYIGGPLSSGTAHFGSYTLNNSSGQNKGFVTKITPQGQFEWATMIGGQGVSGVGGISVSPTGDLYVGGHYYNGNADFDGIILSSPPNIQNVFLARLNTQGLFVQAQKMGNGITSNSVIGLHSPTIDEIGNLYVSGSLKNSVQLGDSLLTATGSSTDAYLAKIKPDEDSFKIIWILQSQGQGNEGAILAQTISSKEHYIYGGYSNGDLIWGGHTLPTQGTNHNAYFAKITNDCSLPTEEIANPLQSVNIYPNPANTNITITNLPQNSTIYITDISGRVLNTQYNKQNSTVQIPLSGISNGMYFVQIINGENRENRKVVVQNSLP